MRETICQHCEAVVAPQAERCEQCGAALERSTSTPSGEAETANETRSWQSNANLAAERRTHLWPTGTLVEGYRITSVLGHGGMGVVYGGVDVESGNEVAIKTVRSTTQTTIHQTRRELQVLRRIDHEGVVPVYQHGVRDGLPWYAMRRVHGDTLSRFIFDLWERPDTDVAGEDESPAAKKPKAGNGHLEECLRVVRDLAATLAYLHGEGIVHRDLKPGNVILTNDRKPIIVDFGLTVQFAVAGRETLDAPENFAGTANYMSPEQCRGEFVDARADIYALGCILFELLTGRKAFPGRRERAISRHLNKPPPIATDLVDDLPPVIGSLLDRLLRKPQRDRLGSAKYLAYCLQEACDAPPVEARGRDFLFRPGFVGRGKRLMEIGNCIGDTVEKATACVFLGGESGIGKTRLAMELAREAKLNGSRILTGRCQPPSRQSSPAADAFPLHPFRSFLEYVVDACREHGSDFFHQRVGSKVHVLAEYEPQFSRLPGAKKYPRPSELPSEAARFRLIDALARTMAQFSRDRHLLFVLDDVQWADELSLNFLALLQSGSWDLQNSAFLSTYRSDELTESLQAVLETCPSQRHVLLDRLDESQVAMIVADMLGLESPDDQFVEFLSARSNGNPFFVAEYLRAALAAGILARDGRGVWQIGSGREDFSSLPLPESVGDLIAKRIGLLSPQARETLDAAAVIGRDFEISMLERVVDRETSEVGEAIESLQFQQLLEPGETQDLQWGHDKLRDATYAAIESERRRQIHARVARALESQAEASTFTVESTARLAVHCELAGDITRAVHFASQAGFLANRQGASNLAVQFFTKALELDGDANQFADSHAYWERQLGEAYMDLGQIERCKEHMSRAVSQLGWPIPRAKWRLVAGLFPQLAKQIWNRLFRRPAAARVAETSAKVDKLREAANAYDRVMRMCYYTNEVPLMFYSALRNINLAEQAGPCTELAVAYASMLGMASLVPVHSAARVYARNAHAVAGQLEDRGAPLWPYLMDGIYRAQLCDWERSAKNFEAGKRLADELGSIRRYEEFVACHTAMLTLRGDFTSAAAGAQTLYQAGARRGDAQVQCWGLLHNARCQLALGHADIARENVERMRREFGWGTHYVEEIWNRQLTTTLALLDGDGLTAEENLRKASELISRGPPIVWFLIPTYEAVALAYLTLYETTDDRDSLKMATSKACRTMMKCGQIIPAAAPRAYRIRGMWQILTGHRGNAIKSFKTSLRLANQLNLAHDGALTQLDWATTAADSTLAAELLRQALPQLAADAPQGGAARRAERALRERQQTS